MTEPRRYTFPYTVDPSHRWGLVISDGDDRLVAVDGTIEDEPAPFEAARHLHPLKPARPPRVGLHLARLAVGPELPAGDYVFTLHRLTDAGAIDPEDDTLREPQTWHLDPTGGRNIYGMHVGAGSQVNNLYFSAAPLRG